METLSNNNDGILFSLVPMEVCEIIKMNVSLIDKMLHGPPTQEEISYLLLERTGFRFFSTLTGLDRTGFRFQPEHTLGPVPISLKWQYCGVCVETNSEKIIVEYIARKIQ